MGRPPATGSLRVEDIRSRWERSSGTKLSLAAEVWVHVLQPGSSLATLRRTPHTGCQELRVPLQPWRLETDERDRGWRVGPLGETDNSRTHTQGTREPQSGEIYRELGLLQPSEGRSGDPQEAGASDFVQEAETSGFPVSASHPFKPGPDPIVPLKWPLTRPSRVV